MQLGALWGGAANYDPGAFFDDGSCILDTEDDCQPDLNEDGLIGVADVLELLSYFGLFCE